MPRPVSAEVKNMWYRNASIRSIRLQGEIYIMSLTEQALPSPVVPLIKYHNHR